MPIYSGHMPTIPPERARPSELEPHRARQVAESFGSDPKRYDRARPRYPDAMVERIVAESPGPDFLDVGIGTGIAARQFQAAGCKVLGVEVDARMAEWARQRGLKVDVAAFEVWDPAGRAFDAVVSGQTWHWVDPVAGAAKAAEALRPGGRLTVFWNAGRPPTEVVEAFAEVYRRVIPDSPAARGWAVGPDGYSVLCTKAADGIRRTAAFSEPEQWRFDWERSYTRGDWLDQLPTTGAHTRLLPATLEELLTGIGAAIDTLGGGFTMRYATMAVTATRTGAARPA
jgi:SAM-dependent methyltransferase